MKYFICFTKLNNALLNEIQIQIWLIRDPEEKNWKYIEKYELRNILDIGIVAPVKHVLNKNPNL